MVVVRGWGASISRTPGYFVDRVVPLTVGSRSAAELAPSSSSLQESRRGFAPSQEATLATRGKVASRVARLLACALWPRWPSGGGGDGGGGYCLENTGGRIAVRVCILWHIVCQAPFHRLLWDMRSADVTASVAGWDFKRLSVSLALTAALVTEGVKNVAPGACTGRP